MRPEQDLILRAVQQLAAAIARIAGLRRAARLEAAVEEIDAALASLAGVVPALLAASDARVVAQALRDPARLALAARLAHERALVEGRRGDGAGARAWDRKAAELYLEAGAAGRVLTGEELDFVRGCAAEVEASYGPALARLPPATGDGAGPGAPPVTS